MKAVGLQFSVNTVTVFNILKRYNIETRTKGGIQALPQQDIVKQYQNGASDSIIAKKYKVSRGTIDNVLNKHKINRSRRWVNSGLDISYFDEINRPDKAYFLGLLITDGNVGNNDNSVKLQIHQRDQYILYNLAKAVNSSNKIYKRHDRPHKKLAIKCRQWKQALSKYGVVPRKTYITKMPVLDQTMMPHMIRGMIDGDGWIYYNQDKNRHAIGFCGAQSAVTNLRDFLVQTLNVSHVKIMHVKQHLWSVLWSAKKDLLAIGQYIYKDKQNFYLTRKYDKFLDIKKKIRGKDNTEVTSQIAKGYEAPQSVEGE